ncbi:MoaD/ThiS family protein [Candidatus Lokiarchaeum ossiferum]|uniref:MoaD/ThiS family protein n=1 Tax=Candidatus Lokiarchaeum ossiferum TaxID=2951803 RepID=UPI00352EE0CC
MGASFTLRVQFFANLREIIGIKETSINFSENQSVDDLLQILRKSYPNGEEFYQKVVDEATQNLQPYVKIIIDGRILFNNIALNTIISPDVKTILIFPPVGGG